MTNTLTISREALLAAANRLSDTGQNKYAAPLWEVLAAPAVERQEPESPKKRCSCKAGKMFWSKIHQKHVSCELHSEQPEPIAVALPDRAAFEAAVSRYSFMDTSDFVNGQYQGSDETQAAWELWQMRAAPVAVVLPERITSDHCGNLGCAVCEMAKAWNACLDKVKEMNR